MNKEEMDKYGYELMVKNNSQEAVKNLLLKDKELERYKNIIDEAIDYLRDIRQSTFTKYNSNEWNNCLSFNDDIKPLLDKLQKLKGE